MLQDTLYTVKLNKLRLKGGRGRLSTTGVFSVWVSCDGEEMEQSADPVLSGEGLYSVSLTFFEEILKIGP
jgi:hypothetical protein